MTAITEAEKAKYARIWAIDEYHEHSPGAAMVPLFEEIAKPQPGSTILDIGAGDGAASRVLQDKGYVVAAMDLVDAGWKHHDIYLYTGSIWKGLPGAFRFGYSCDVMEHIPTQFVALSVVRMLEACQRVFLGINFNPDHFGARIGEPLHLTVKPFSWWRDTLREVGNLTEARDLMGMGVFYLEP